MSSTRGSCTNVQVCQKNYNKKSFFLFLDPIGSSGPKFMVNTDGLRQHSSINANIGLSCPAQAFPVPKTRYQGSPPCINHICIFTISFLFIEPIGSSSPKFVENTNGLVVVSKERNSIDLSCPAQAYPVPFTR